MLIGGIQRFSLIEYPQKICCVVFTQGCNFNCPYCHNPELVNPKLFNPKILPELFFDFLEKRKEKLDAVVITGGEPTLQTDLRDFIKKIKSMDFLVKLETNGSKPEVIKQLLNDRLLDFIAMDIKSNPANYQAVTGIATDPDIIKQSIGLIMNSGIEYEFVTTVLKDLITKEQILEIGKLIKGARRYILQRFKPSQALNPQYLNSLPFSDEELKDLKQELFKHYRIQCVIR